MDPFLTDDDDNDDDNDDDDDDDESRRLLLYLSLPDDGALRCPQCVACTMPGRGYSGRDGVGT